MQQPEPCVYRAVNIFQRLRIILQQVISIINICINFTMKSVTVSLTVCLILTLTRALQEAEYEYWTDETTPPDIFNAAEDGWHPNCPEGWTMYSTHCVLFVTTLMTWTEAEAYCRSRGGNLLSLLIPEQAYDIQKEMQKAGHEYKQLWVGGHKKEGNPSWSWSDYMFSTFDNWCSEENAEHDCLQINFEENASGCLDDMDCDTQLPSVCGIIIM
ncbi:hypothetical protein Q5P01_002865 [Channa striata]|uniref:C-type lectin domain-containing protein n=1 Tax=Channa striata TaxID=64152 RepID=A0AA88NNG8_CHASR|nr:hypothetical protein Q5P01_002865 [Channa striata]